MLGNIAREGRNTRMKA